MGDQCIVPAPESSEGYVELASVPKARGRVFRKQILNLGDLNYKGKTFKLDDAWYDQLEKNFKAGVSMTQVPIADKDNKHTESPLANTGEVVGIERQGNKVYTLVDIRDPDVAQRIADGRILGASAFLHMDYEDTRTGEKVGPALLHHLLTNRPHCLDLSPYEEIAASADGTGEVLVLAQEESVPAQEEVIAASADGTGEVLILAQEAPRMPTKEELLAQLKAEHGIDVEDLQAQAAQRSDMSQLTAMLTEALRPASGDLQLTAPAGETVSLTDVVGAVAELAEKNVSLSGTVQGLQKQAAENEVDGYVSAGRLLPKTRKHAVKLVLSGDREGLDEILAPADQPYVKLNHVEGSAPPQGEQRHIEDLDAEVLRLSAVANSLNGSGRK